MAATAVRARTPRAAALAVAAAAAASGSAQGQDATPTPPPIRYTWSNCRCKVNWEEGGKTCSDGCCNFEDDEWGNYCYVQDSECEDSDWGYCRPESMATAGCTDYPPDWTDADGDGCYSYVFNGFCTASGGHGAEWDEDWGGFDAFTMNGYDASTACCSCGGGSDTNQGYNDDRCADAEGWTDKDGDGCSQYSEYFLCTAAGQPGIGWHEEWGTLSDFKAGGKSAIEACCACGGGSKGVYTGTLYTPTPDDDTAGVEVPSGVAWAVVSGPCKKDSSDCILSPNYPKTYGNNEKCVIGVNVDKISYVTAEAFSTEWGYDVLKINGQTYSGTMGPYFVKPVEAIVWSSDSEVGEMGWRLCREATLTPPAPRYTWSNCKCKVNWEEGGKTCSDGCCNFEDDEWGDYCYVEDPQCEDSDWGYCKPESMATSGCTDYPPDWTDSDGDDCFSYEFNDFCTASGGRGEGWDSTFGTFGSFAMNGYDASAACCSCGGGSDTNQGYNDNRCADAEGWTDKDGDGCSAYSEAFFCTAAGQPGFGWHEEWGTLSDFKAGGKSAVEACCACGGGSKGMYTSTQYTPQPNPDTAGVEVPSGVAWAVASGPCTKDSSDCILSPNYPKTYGNNEKCVIGVNVGEVSYITAEAFSTEWGYDTLKINGETYSGTVGPSFVWPLDAIVWSSDSELGGTGWRLCREATPTPPAVRYTWSDCKCKVSWEEGGKMCSDGCCNFEDDEWGDYCYVEDPQCEDFEWGYCRPESMATAGCTDYPPDWTDSDGDDCFSYEFNDFCTASGGRGEGWDNNFGTFGSFAMNGYDASTACCSCGGGSDTFQGYNDNQCADTVSWTDKDGDDCAIYSDYFFCTIAGQPGFGWHDEWGTLSDFKAGGKSAVEACCACGGGSKGTYNGTQYTPPPDPDTAGVEVPSGVAWAVASGPCTKDRSDCILSPNYPKAYGNNEKCVIGVNVDAITDVTADTFSTEWGYDTLRINGITYSGTMGPVSVKPLGPIVWSSDFESAQSGWRLCPPGAAPFEGLGASGSGSILSSAFVAIGILTVVACCWRRMRGKTDTGMGDGIPRGVSAERDRMED